MNPAPPRYLLDANVFIEAHRRYYAFDLCPGFWECLLAHHRAGRVLSIDRVREEISGTDPLGDWVKRIVPKSFFDSTSSPQITAHFGEMMQWVHDKGQFKTEAVNEFAKVADGWLAAYAKATNAILVTHEEYRPDSRKRVPLPNVCRQFGVPFQDTFSMLRDLQSRFVIG